MNLRAFAIGLLLLAGSSEAAGEPPGPVRADSSFVRDGVEYRIRAEKFAATTCNSSAIRIAYRVWRGGVFLHPEDPNGGRQVAPVFQSEQPAPLDLAPFPDAEAPVGWSIRCGYGSGNTSNNLAVVVLPQKDSYGEVVWEWVSFGDWTVVRSGEAAEVWTLARDEGRTGTWGNVFLPERRVLSKRGSSIRLEQRALDPDWRRWPERLSSLGFSAAFVAGVRQENPALMRSALDLWTPDLRHWCEEFGLPADFRGLVEMTDAVEALVAAKQRVRAVSQIEPMGAPTR